MFFDTVLHHIRYGARVLRRNPGSTAVAVFALAVGIGREHGSLHDVQGHGCPPGGRV
jgi:hypothetical protein